MQSKVFQPGILKVAIAGMLGAVLLAAFAASARLSQEGRWERATVSTSGAASAKVLQAASFSVPTAVAYPAAPAPARHKLFAGFLRKFWTLLAAAALVLPFGLSTLRILHRNRPA